MALTDTAIKNAKPKAKPYKLADEKGLHLLVHPSAPFVLIPLKSLKNRRKDGLLTLAPHNPATQSSSGEC